MSPELPVVQCEAMTFARRHDGVFSTALLMIAMAVSSLLRLGAAGSQGIPKLVPVDEAPRRPSFLLLIQADDLGHGDLSDYGQVRSRYSTSG
jgi:hypothetical protein